MTTLSAHPAHDQRQWTSVEQTGGGFANYLTMLREAFTEALQQTQDARRKYPFADV
ncbi:MAG: hypothetical protein WC670_01470 [Pseudolabrys sp.]|jgi:hypothetical protein